MHLEQGGIEYYNSGGWIDSRLTYITVGEEGVRIHEYKEPVEDRAKENAGTEASATEISDDSELFDDADFENEYEEVGL